MLGTPRPRTTCCSVSVTAPLLDSMPHEFGSAKHYPGIMLTPVPPPTAPAGRSPRVARQPWRKLDERNSSMAAALVASCGKPELPVDWTPREEVQLSSLTLPLEPVGRFLPALPKTGAAAAAAAAAAVVAAGGSGSSHLSETALEQRAYAAASPRRLIPVGWSLQAERPVWWKPSQHVKEASTEFDLDHRALVGSSCIAHHKLHTHAGSQDPVANESSWERALWDLRWNRFTGDRKPPPPPTPIKASKRKAAKAKPFDVWATFWASRRDCDSEDLYDTDECYAKLVALDWSRALDDGRIGRLVERVERRSGGDDDDDDGTELQDCERVLCDNARLVYRLYDEYSILGASSTDDVYSIGFKGYMQVHHTRTHPPPVRSGRS